MSLSPSVRISSAADLRTSARPIASRLAAAALVAIGLFACAGTSTGGDGSSSPLSQTTVDDWRDYCIATFTREFPIRDSSGDVAFTAAVGDEFVMASFDAGESPELVYLAEEGPDILMVEAESDDLPSPATAQPAAPRTTWPSLRTPRSMPTAS